MLFPQQLTSHSDTKICWEPTQQLLNIYLDICISWGWRRLGRRQPFGIEAFCEFVVTLFVAFQHLFFYNALVIFWGHQNRTHCFSNVWSISVWAPKLILYMTFYIHEFFLLCTLCMRMLLVLFDIDHACTRYKVLVSVGPAACIVATPHRMYRVALLSLLL